ncbi:protein Wnt-8b-like [Dendronephthya gigantea]|uniref:protein Wnt-8b-like n=1 Tax=Dendronephthya gigantea TaxID=151771 RepID=UPI001069246E|nr:protein Wnt-8b-like [Dendronephthya gigantea]XP_028405163.1 protein Wnt-8b-like [Dendronephthya gigantea]XP_028405164.1 protein Wnt-8b-like [Dendronephthya gigantea]XP_028405166.1 protein Wnt-8b-like [Dendronephthya gigantea]
MIENKMAFLIIIVCFTFLSKGTNAREQLQLQSKDYLKYSKSVMTGAKMGLKECYREFKYEPWNCYVSNDIKVMPIVNRARLPLANKEAAFIHAITSAGVMHSIIVNCSLGHLENCRCLPKSKQKVRSSRDDSPVAWQWGGCSDNVAFGDLVARHFVDALEGKKGENEDRRALNLHNNKVGRKMVKGSTKKVCKCHGSSSSCTTKTCMKKVEKFEKVADALWEKYHTALRVVYKNGSLFDQVDKKVTKRRVELAYFTRSPNYCRPNRRLKIPGVEGRVCEAGSQNDLKKCTKLCESCGLKMKLKVVTRKEKCNCKFVWCCYVKCEECEKRVLTATCTR